MDAGRKEVLREVARAQAAEIARGAQRARLVVDGRLAVPRSVWQDWLEQELKPTRLGQLREVYTDKLGPTGRAATAGMRPCSSSIAMGVLDEEQPAITEYQFELTAKDARCLRIALRRHFGVLAE